MATKLDLLKEFYNDSLIIFDEYLGESIFNMNENEIDYVYIYNQIHLLFVKDDETANKYTLKTLLYFQNISVVNGKTFDEFFEVVKTFIKNILDL